MGNTTYKDTHKFVQFARALGMINTELVVYFLPFVFDGGDTDHTYLAIVANMEIDFTHKWMLE